jgi:ABC-type bacteriocin/lantibiotic exporter with double-glycine peptidase domain
MSTELPLYRQEKAETCALACLRMVLAAFGFHVSESDLEAEATMEEGGTSIQELERLARQFGLVADIREATVEQLRQILAQGQLPIVFLDRAVFDLTPRQRATHLPFHAKVHAVVPIRVTDASIIFHDPLPPCVTRRSIRSFREAHQLFDNACVVCSNRNGKPVSVHHSRPKR